MVSLQINQGNAFGKFKAADWNNVVVAGGSVLAAVLGCNHLRFADSDIDVFLYELTEDQARVKCARLWELLKVTSKSLAVRTPHR
jgi:hypothetical protein